MTYDFYKSEEYRANQSRATKLLWEKGKFDFLRKQVQRVCRRTGCTAVFSVHSADPKKYCTRRCAALVNSPNRSHSLETRAKMSRSLTGKRYPHRLKEPPRSSVCKNPTCGAEFLWRYWRPAHKPIQYCSIKCSIRTIGSLPTSPRAARAKSGIPPTNAFSVAIPKIYPRLLSSRFQYICRN